MSTEIREARPDEIGAFRRLVTYVFADNETDPDRPPAHQRWPAPERTLCAVVDGRLASAMGVLPLRMRWNGRAVDVAGVTAVGTEPGFRRGGLLRRVKRHGFADQRDRGESLAILWASFGAIYQRFGYGPASTGVEYQVDPRDLAFLDERPPAGRVVTVPVEEARPVLAAIHERHIEPRHLALHRTADAWGEILATRRTLVTRVAVHHAPGGEPTGYLVYVTREDDAWGEPGANQVLRVRDAVALDLDAYRGLWWFLRAHDLVRRITVHPPEDDPLPWLVQEPRALRRRTSDAIWLRVVDVERALAARPYAADGALALAVQDDVCDWNDGRFLLEVEGGEPRLTRTTRDPDLALPVRSLAMLASGHVSATALARARLVEAPDHAALARADAMFATAHRPYCPDGF